MSTHFDPTLLQRPRPTSVLVIAIFHLVIGALGLICLPIGLAANSLQTAQGNPQAQKLQKMQEELEKRIPAYTFVHRFELGIGLLFDGLLLLGGIGLLGMRPWGRTLSLFYAWLSIGVKVLAIIYSFVWALPATLAVFDEMMADEPIARAMVLVGVVGSFLVFLYPIVVLIVLTRRSVAAAFQAEPTPPALPPQDDLDEGRPFAAQPERPLNPEDRIT